MSLLVLTGRGSASGGPSSSRFRLVEEEIDMGDGERDSGMPALVLVPLTCTATVMAGEAIVWLLVFLVALALAQAGQWVR